MFSVKPMIKSAALACAALGMAVSAPALAGVVIKSSGPSASKYPVGSKVDDRGRITLKAGDSVTILTNGRTRVLSGAGEHRVAVRGASKRSAFANLTRQRSGARARAGVSRGTGGAETPKRSNIWYVDVSQSGPMCVSDMASIRMWRPGKGEAATYMFASTASPDHIHVNFAEDMMVSDWDTSRMQLLAGTEYTITGPGSAEPVAITFVELDGVPNTPESLAEMLIANGCNSQLDLLADTMM